MNFWKLYACSLKLPILHQKNSLNFIQICSYQMVGIHNLNGKKNVLNSDSCIYERRCTFFKKVSNEYENTLKIQDSVPTDYSLIYRIQHLSYLKLAQYTVAISVGVIPFTIYYKYFSYIPINEISLGNMFFTEVEFNVFLVSFFLFNFAVRSLVSKSPIRIYANEDGKYKSIYLGLLPWNFSTHSFAKGEVEKVEPFLTILPWSDSYYRMKKRKAILSTFFFRKPSDLYDMLKSEET